MCVFRTETAFNPAHILRPTGEELMGSSCLCCWKALQLGTDGAPQTHSYHSNPQKMSFMNCTYWPWESLWEKLKSCLVITLCSAINFSCRITLQLNSQNRLHLSWFLLLLQHKTVYIQKWMELKEYSRFCENLICPHHACSIHVIRHIQESQYFPALEKK